MAVDRMRDLLNAIGDQWEIRQPSDPDDITRVFDSLPNTPPPDLRALYAFSNGGYLGDVAIFVLFELQNVNQQPALFGSFPSAIYFASDGGDGFFMIDTGDDLGFGVNCIFWCDRSALQRDYCVPCGVSLVGFLQSVARGERPWDGDTVRKLGVRHMQQALEAHAGQWIASPPATPGEVRRAGQQAGAAVPVVLRDLLLISDGITFGGSGVTIASAAQLIGLGEPVTEANLSPAVLFARDAVFHYALTTGVWNEQAGVPPTGDGYVLRFRLGQSLDRAENIGWLPDVVGRWLERQESGTGEQ